MGSVTVRSIVERGAWLALAGLLLASLLAQLGRFGWLPELATHFRIQYLAVALLLVVVFAVLRRPVPALLAAALLVLQGWYGAAYLLPLATPRDPPAAGAPRLLSLNLYYRNHDHDAVRDYLRARDPDVLVLSELTPEWVRELAPVTAGYPYWKSVDQRGPWGLGVFSRHPLREAVALDLGVPGSVNVRAIVELPGGALDLVAVHLSSPTSAARAAMRNRQLEALAKLLGPAPAAGAPPRLLVGDMNLTPFSPYFGALLAQTGLRDARQPDGLLGTWPSWLPPMQITIDHCLVDAALAATRVRRGPDVGSDHYPLEVALLPAR